MPSGMSDYLENKILEHALGKTPYTSPTVYAALYTAVPTEAGSVSEIIGAGYARVQATFGTAVNGSISNSLSITFPPATANWGNIVAVGLVDSPTVGSGNLLWYGSLDVAKSVLNTDQYTLPANSVIINLN